MALLKTTLHLINRLDKASFSSCYLLVRDSYDNNYASSEKVSEILKGREIGAGHRANFGYNGNTGKIEDAETGIFEGL